MRPIPKEAFMTASYPGQLPAPVRGWNARDSITAMRPDEAIYLDNWFPSTTDVGVRKGSSAWATVPAGKSVKTLMDVSEASGSRKLFAATDSGLYDITSQGDKTVIAKALTSGKVEYVTINVAGTHYTWCCNGTDNSFIYNADAGTFADLTPSSVPSLTGINSNDVTHVSLFANRIILCKLFSLSFFYLPLNSVGGAASEFDLGAVFRKGGYLVATASWTMDAGDGIDDRFVAISSEGEIVVYQGSDPSSATAFSLIGRFDVGKPIGKRCFLRYGGDLVLITQDGVWPLTKALLNATVSRKEALSDRIQNAFQAYAQTYGTPSYFGWQGVLHPIGPALLINVPVGNSQSYQFVMNTISGAWCRFTGWNAECMMSSNNRLFFAIGRNITLGWTGDNDKNTDIVARAKTAFVYGAARGRQQQVALIRPVLSTGESLETQMGLTTDYADDGALSTTTLDYVAALALWDVSIWDTSIWGGLAVVSKWRTVAHTPGKAFSLRLQCSVQQPVRWSVTDIISQPGNIFG